MNKYQIASVIGEIDDELITESGKNTVKRRSLLRWTAAAAALLIAVGAAFGIANAASHNAKEERFTVPDDAVLPPVQVGKHSSSTSYERDYSIPEAYSEAEFVCLARVGNWLGEDEAGTFYEVTPITVYKGELSSPFVLWAFGNSEFTLKSTPLFTYGDVLLLFLTHKQRGEYTDVYDSIGADISLLYAAYDNEDNVFLIDHRGLMTYETSIKNPEISMNDRGKDGRLVSELCSNMRIYNKYMAEGFERYYNVSVNDPDHVSFPLHVFSLEEVVNTCFR